MLASNSSVVAMKWGVGVQITDKNTSLYVSQMVQGNSSSNIKLERKSTVSRQKACLPNESESRSCRSKSREKGGIIANINSSISIKSSVFFPRDKGILSITREIKSRNGRLWLELNRVDQLYKNASNSIFW